MQITHVYINVMLNNFKMDLSFETLNIETAVVSITVCITRQDKNFYNIISRNFFHRFFKFLKFSLNLCAVTFWERMVALVYKAMSMIKTMTEKYFLSKKSPYVVRWIRNRIISWREIGKGVTASDSPETRVPLDIIKAIFLSVPRSRWGSQREETWREL